MPPQKNNFGKNQQNMIRQTTQRQQEERADFPDVDPISLEEERVHAEENIYNTHLDAVKEEVQLIQREGEMITTLERAIKNEEEYDMSDYLASARAIAM